MFKLNEEKNDLDWDLIDLEEVIALNPSKYEEEVYERLSEEYHPAELERKIDSYEPDFELVCDWYENELNDILEGLLSEAGIESL